MSRTRKAVVIIITLGIGIAAGVSLEPYLSRTLKPKSGWDMRHAARTPSHVTDGSLTEAGNAARRTRDKGLFLDNLLLALNTYGRPDAVNGDYLHDPESVYARLAELLQDDSEAVAESAAAVISVMALMQRTTDIAPVSESAAVKSALENVIAHGVHDEARGRAIDAWVLMYPPDATMIGTLESILQSDMDRYPESHAAAFRAYGNYRHRYNYPLPDSTLATASRLLEHPSRETRVKAEYALAELGGTSVLPTLIAQLEQTGNSSEGRMLTAIILRLDNSRETVDELNRITSSFQ